MPIRVTLTTAGLSRIAARANRAANFLDGDGMRDVVTAAGKDMVKEFQTNIMNSTPGDMKDLRPATKDSKRRRFGRVYPILYATGEMFRSMYAYVTKTRAAGWNIQIRYKGANNTTKATAHLHGTGHLPKRDFTKLSRAWHARLFNSIRAGLRRARGT